MYVGRKRERERELLASSHPWTKRKAKRGRMVDHRTKLEIFWRRQEAWQLNKILEIIVLSFEKRSAINSVCVATVSRHPAPIPTCVFFRNSSFTLSLSLSLFFAFSVGPFVETPLFAGLCTRAFFKRHPERVRLTSESQRQGIYTAAHAVTLAEPASFSSSFETIIERTKTIVDHRRLATLADSFTAAAPFLLLLPTLSRALPVSFHAKRVSRATV